MKLYVVSTKDGRKGYFSSLAAIFTRFTRDDIGCRVERLWSFGVAPDHPFINSRCSIEVAEIVSNHRIKD